MSQAKTYFALATLLAAVFSIGCGIRPHQNQYQSGMLKFDSLVESSNGRALPVEIEEIPEETLSPITVNGEPRIPLPMSLDEAVAAALENSKVLRDLGGRLIQAPQTARTIMDPAITETDAKNGIEGALSAFDANFASSLFFENNDRAVNNPFDAQGVNIFQQDFGTFQAEIEKTSASGTSFSLGQNIVYDINNAPQNIFDGGWSTQILAEVRQPLLQGKGTAFNRVAGPDATPGNIQGVVIARLNTDISQLDFEISVRDLVNNIENSYWDLYFAYRLLESRMSARDASLDTWKKVEAKHEKGLAKPGQLEQASEQYWRFEEEVISARTGRVIDGTRSNNGSTGGTFQANIGVHVAERRLRLLMGWPINDQWEIRPKEDPEIAEVTFEWNEILGEAIRNRSEVRRQELFVKRGGLEVAANQNFLLPRVDLVGGYRWRGFGDDLINSNRDGRPRFDNAFMDLTSGDFQEWFFGTETALPIGFRRAHSAVRNAKLKQSRQQAILDEVKREVVHDLSNAYADLARTYKLTKINFNRRAEAHKRTNILKAMELGIGVDIDSILDAERRAADADSHFFQSLVGYVVAIKNVHLEKGSLLKYNKVYLADIAPSDAPSTPSQSAAPAFSEFDNEESPRSEPGPELNSPIKLNSPILRSTKPTVEELPKSVSEIMPPPEPMKNSIVGQLEEEDVSPLFQDLAAPAVLPPPK
ncbi:MAG: outer membrane protein TolC [Mariniblastus sp.]|jgi:outer membrane protein TolC